MSPPTGRIPEPRRASDSGSGSGIRRGTSSADLIRGDLSEYRLADLLQFIASLGRDGQLLIEQDLPLPRSAGIYFMGGQVVHAQLPPFVGEEAFFRLLEWQSGRFVFLMQARPERQTIAAELKALLLDGLREQDEYHALLAQLPDLSMVAHRRWDREAIATVQVSFADLSVYDLVDGRRSFADIIELIPGDRRAVASRLVFLLGCGAITTHSDVAFLDAIVLERLGSEHRPGGARQPPSALACQILRYLDSGRPLAWIATQLPCTDHEFVLACRDLVLQRWAGVARGHERFARHLL